MDPSKFDDLTKAIATSTSRRQALKTIAATTLGGILGLGGIGTAFGAPKPPKKCHNNGLGCSRNDQCCSSFCDQTTGTCACAPGTTDLNGTCCPTAQVCNGVCCPSGQSCQNGFCVTPGTIQNCCVCPDLSEVCFCQNTCPPSNFCDAPCAGRGTGNPGQICNFIGVCGG